MKLQKNFTWSSLLILVVLLPQILLFVGKSIILTVGMESINKKSRLP
jgi:hypothetical protein